MSSSSELKSHPQKPLEVHLFNVAKFSKESVLEKYIENKELYSQIAFLIGVSHDFAKSTTYFQKYLFDHKTTQLARHGLLSAVFGYYVIHEYINNNHSDDFWFFAPIAWIVILRHHGNIKNIMGMDGEAKKLKDDIGHLKKQILDIKENNFEELTLIYTHWDIDVEKFFLKFDNIISKIKKDLKKLSRGEGPENYFLILFFYSILLDADKLDASETEKPNRIPISGDLVDKFKKLKFEDNKSGINKIREESYLEVINSLNLLELSNEKILSINLPTGCGKTLTGLSFSLKLRKRIEKEMGFSPKIIYSLPFLSIIDQNAEIFSEILSLNGSKSQKNITSNLFLKHHHLSDVRYIKNDEQDNGLEMDTGKSKLLIEGWYSEVIVTTFIQLFYSLITNKNRAARKFHNITNSIIILDEIQSVPSEYWESINLILKYLSQQFNCWIILMTATEPLIFKSDEEIKPLVSQREKYFNEFNRIDYEFNLETEEFDDFKEIVWNEIVSKPEKDIMVVLNTINSSQELYGHIRDKLEGNISVDEIGIANVNNTKLINLSTLIIPNHRLKRIKKIKEGGGKRNIIITTQIVEAGVDISVNIIFRDMAPLDSIVQTAGRCNRNNSCEKGLTKIFVLKDHSGKHLSSYVYNSTLISATHDVIDGKTAVEERDFNLSSVPMYYNFILERGSQEKSRKLVECIEKLEFSEFKKEFKLISGDYEKIDVFIEVDETAQSLWERYKQISEIENRFQRKEEFLKIKPNFYNYVISVNIKKLGKVVLDSEWLAYLDFASLSRKYDLETGFIPNNQEDVFII
jgi:CRISPR-associated endonuclease/helicase Cas3